MHLVFGRRGPTGTDGDRRGPTRADGVSCGEITWRAIASAHTHAGQRQASSVDRGLRTVLVSYVFHPTPTHPTHTLPCSISCGAAPTHNQHTGLLDRSDHSKKKMAAEFRGTYTRQLYPVDDTILFYHEPSIHSRPLVKHNNAEHEGWLRMQMEHYERQLRANTFADDPRTTFGTVFDVENVPDPVHRSNPLAIIESCTDDGGLFWYNVGCNKEQAAWVHTAN